MYILVCSCIQVIIHLMLGALTVLMPCVHHFSCVQWLEEDLFRYLSDWEKSVKKRKGFTAAQKKLMMMPDSTVEGIKITGASYS